jgi:hypothetical protein
MSSARLDDEEEKTGKDVAAEDEELFNWVSGIFFQTSILISFFFASCYELCFAFIEKLEFTISN